MHLCSDYLKSIKYPMDLTSIKANLYDGAYAHPNEFAEDIRYLSVSVLECI